MQTDLIVVQAYHLDFPYFRKLVRTYRSLFNKVFIVFSNHYEHIDCRSFIQKTMFQDDVVFLEANWGGGQDWRNISVNTALQQSSSEFVLFIEQDFSVYNDLLFQSILSQPKTVSLIEENTGRWHPAFLYLQRKILEKTSKNFSATQKFDHFGQIRLDLTSLNEEVCSLESRGFYAPRDWEHMAGITHNYTLLMRGQENQVQYKRKIFASYNQELLSLNIEQDPIFTNVIKRAANLK